MTICNVFKDFTISVAFVHVKAISKEICKVRYIFCFFENNAESAYLFQIKAKLSQKNAWLPSIFFTYFNSPYDDLHFPHSRELGKIPL